MKILVLNSGSSSLKYQVIDTDTGEMLVKGNYERVGQVGAFLTHKVNGEKHKFEHPAKNHEKAIKFVMERLTSEKAKAMLIFTAEELIKKEEYLGDIDRAIGDGRT